MTALDRKLVRDLMQMKGQSIAIALVIASGVATFVMSVSTLHSLKQTRQQYYEQTRFAHAWASMKRAPKSLAQRIEAIPGLATVQPRIVVDVNLDIEGLIEPAVGRIISLPRRHGPALNNLYLRRGRFPEPRADGEVLVSQHIADAHGFNPGDAVTAVINEKRERLRIVGIALSPEYIINLREGDLLPDDERFGVFWMHEDQLAAAFDLDGAFNSVTVSYMRGADEREILKRLDDLTEPYGGIGAYGRTDQLSYRYLSDEIQQLTSMAFVTPVIFLGVAAFLLHVVMSRLISTQREQIAALKAFGYAKRDIAGHYLKLVLLIVIVGAVLGVAVGAWMGSGLTQLYTTFYKFPIFDYDLPMAVIAPVLLIACAAVRRAAALPPAEAMRPEPPASYHPSFIERLGAGRFLAQTGRMIVRHLSRQPVKSILSAMGIAMATSILVAGSFGEDALDYLMHFDFDLAQRQDVMVNFTEPKTADAAHAVTQLPGVIAAEPYRALATRLRHGHHARRVGVMGLGERRDLFRLIDDTETPVDLPPEGLVLSAKLAEILDVDVGESVIVEVLEGERPERRVPVAGVIRDFSGLNAYMHLDAVHDLMNEGGALSGAFLTVDPRRADALYRDLKITPGVASVNVKAAALRSFQETFAENILRLRLFNIFFASVIAFGVVYNTARISLAERSRELATMRVIGFTRAEISAVLLGELAVLTAVAIPLGLVLGYVWAAVTAIGLNTEVYRIPLVIDASTFAFAATVIMIAALISGLVVRRRLDRLDLISVLKSRE